MGTVASYKAYLHFNGFRGSIKHFISQKEGFCKRQWQNIECNINDTYNSLQFCGRSLLHTIIVAIDLCFCSFKATPK